MNTPLNFGIPIESSEISDSKDSRCRPKEFRSNLISKILEEVDQFFLQLYH